MCGKFFTPIGELNIIDVLFYYDGPRIFIGQNEASKFLGFLVDEIDEWDQWLFAPVSKERVSQIKKGIISIREALLNVEDGWVFEIKLPVIEKASATVELRRPQDIPLQYLPQEESYIKVGEENDTVQTANELPNKRASTLEEAVESSRDVLDISISGFEDEHELSCERAGNTLRSYQMLAYSLDSRWKQNQKRPPHDVIHDNAANLTALFAASFGIRIKSRQHSGLFKDTDATAAIRRLSKLVSSSQDKDNLRAHLKTLTPRAAAWYQRFLENFREDTAQLKLEWASPNRDHDSTILTRTQLLTAYDILKETTETTVKLELEGTLIAINLKRNTFYIVCDDDNYYSGALSHEIVNQVSKGYTFEVPMPVCAIVESREVLNLSTEMINTSYKLLAIRPIS